MLKIAHNISNLSDARYFAAYGFDWLLFNFGPGSSEHKHIIYGISEWISGSKIGIVAHNMEELNFYITNIPELKGFWINVDIGKLSNLPDDITIFNNTIDQDYANSFKIMSSSKELNYHQNKLILDLTTQNPSTLDLTDLSLDGVCISGTDEDQPGSKSYSNMEEWIEILEEM